MTGAHDPTRLGLELYTRDILNDEIGQLHNVPGSQVRRIAQRVVDMVLREFTPSHVGLHKVIPVPVCPDCHALMTKETDEDVDGVMLVHWTCRCEWDGTCPTAPPVDVVGLFCSNCGENITPRPDMTEPVPCPQCDHPMSLRLVKGEDRGGWGITSQPPHAVVKTGEDGEVTSG